MLRMLLLIVLLALLTSCASTGAGRSDPCAGWRAIYVSGGDVLTAGTARAVLAHNLTGQKLGCW